ncbi:MAG: hypothetical protein R3A46_14980 [Thermomicrobiales bacterium]
MREFDAVMIDRDHSVMFVWLFDANQERTPQIFDRLCDHVSDELADVFVNSKVGHAEFPVDGLTFDALLESVLTVPAGTELADQEEKERVEIYAAGDSPLLNDTAVRKY